jgi:hypothetical protein
MLHHTTGRVSIDLVLQTGCVSNSVVLNAYDCIWFITIKADKHILKEFL